MNRVYLLKNESEIVKVFDNLKAAKETCKIMNGEYKGWMDLSIIKMPLLSECYKPSFFCVDYDKKKETIIARPVFEDFAESVNEIFDADGPCPYMIVRAYNKQSAIKKAIKANIKGV